MKKLLCLLAFGLANAFSLNSFAQAVPKGSGVNMQYKHRPLGNIAIGLAALGLLFAVSVSAQSSEKQQKYDAAVAACKAVFYPKYCNFMNMDLSGLDLTAEPAQCADVAVWQQRLSSVLKNILVNRYHPGHLYNQCHGHGFDPGHQYSCVVLFTQYCQFKRQPQ